MLGLCNLILNRKATVLHPPCPTDRIQHLSHTLWNNQHDSTTQPPLAHTKSRDNPRRSTDKPAQLIPQPSREPLHSVLASFDTRQWEEMHAFSCRSQLWPSLERLKMEGRSPLVWTTIYPPLTTTWLQTYAWDGHLDNFMPWSASNPNLAIRPSLISHAMWNCWKESNLPKSQDSSAPPNKCFHPSSQTLARPTQQPGPAHHSNGLTKPLSLAWHEPNPLPLASPNTSPLITSRNMGITWVVSLMLFLHALLSHNTGLADKPISPPMTRHWHNPRLCRILVVKTRKSCSRRTRAIIQ